MAVARVHWKQQKNKNLPEKYLFTFRFFSFGFSISPYRSIKDRRYHEDSSRSHSRSLPQLIRQISFSSPACATSSNLMRSTSEQGARPRRIRRIFRVPSVHFFCYFFFIHRHFLFVFNRFSARTPSLDASRKGKNISFVTQSVYQEFSSTQSSRSPSLAYPAYIFPQYFALLFQSSTCCHVVSHELVWGGGEGNEKEQSDTSLRSFPHSGTALNTGEA